MKITKRQLRRIIKEEKAKVLAEQKVRRIVRTRLMEQAGQGLVLIPGFTSYVAPLSPDGLHAATSGHRELPPGPWQEAWDDEDTPAVVAELSKLGVTHIGGDDGEGIAEMMGLPGSVVTLAQFAKAFG
tara:strand:+ start:269 stop:652 length:384 start_codon:yes stop_codon:yes gene_type:complete